MLVDRFPRAGETRVGRDAMETPGGKGSNQAIQAARWGAGVSLIASLGGDAAGDTAIATWQAEGIDTVGVVRHPGRTSGQACVIVDESGENRIVLAPAANLLLTSQHVEAARGSLSKAAVVAATLETPVAATLHAFGLARQAGVVTLLNAAPAASHPLPEGLWSLLDILVVNEVEAAAVCGAPTDADPLSLGPTLARRVGRFAIITLGAKGAVLFDSAGVQHHCAAPRVPVIDTTGAGDAFIGAFASSWAQHADARLALRQGVVAGSLACTARGCVPALPRRAAIDALLPDVMTT